MIRWLKNWLEKRRQRRKEAEAAHDAKVEEYIFAKLSQPETQMALREKLAQIQREKKK